MNVQEKQVIKILQYFKNLPAQNPQQNPQSLNSKHKRRIGFQAIQLLSYLSI